MINKLKNHLAGLAIIGLVSGAGIANASLGDIKFYAGAGVDYNSYNTHNDNTKQQHNNAMGLTPVLGVKFHENVGVEAGYGFNKAIKTSTDKKYKVTNMHVDLMGNMPLADKVDLLGGIGIGKLKLKDKDKSSTGVKFKNKVNWRLKFGAQYNFSDNIAMRAIALYQKAGNKYESSGKEYKFLKNIKSIGLSAVYKF
jgi:opacity protein-like surface antigen